MAVQQAKFSLTESHGENGMQQRIVYADWTTPELLAMGRCLLTGQVHEGPAPQALAARMSDLYAPSRVHLLGSAHHGIEVALEQFRSNCPGRNEVIVPAYICPSVPASVRSCGLTVRWVEVGGDLNLSVSSVARAISPQTLAVIAPHMFGCPAPIESLESLCRDAGVALIDDAAQVVGVRVAGRLLGTFGDAGVISFAQTKAIVTGVHGSGGALLVNRPSALPRVGDVLSRLVKPSGRLAALADFWLNYQARHYLGGLGHRVAKHRPEWLGRTTGPDSRCRISHLDASVALVQLGRLDELVAEKRRIVKMYREVLSAFPNLGFPQYGDDRFLARVMLLLPEGVNREQVRARAVQLGLETRLGYVVTADAAYHGPRAVALSNRLLGVPVRRGMRETDVTEICSVLDDVVRHCRTQMSSC
jgi:dTDP-4-amino-4,6-dideoxygalactose transaminase